MGFGELRCLLEHYTDIKFLHRHRHSPGLKGSEVWKFVIGSGTSNIYSAGTKIEVMDPDDGEWYSGKVLEPKGGAYEVRYYKRCTPFMSLMVPGGCSTTHNATITPDNIRLTTSSGGIIFKPEERAIYLDYIMINTVYRKKKIFAKLVAFIIKFAQGWMTVDKLSLQAYEIEDGHPPHGIYAHYGFQPSEGMGGKSLKRTTELIEELANWDHKKEGRMIPWMAKMKRKGPVKSNGNRMVPPLKMHLDLRGLPVDNPAVWTETNPRLSWLSKQLEFLSDPRFGITRANAQALVFYDDDPTCSPKAYRFDLIEPDCAQIERGHPGADAEEKENDRVLVLDAQVEDALPEYDDPTNL